MTMAPERDSLARDVLVARLNDPAVASSLATLLDHADLLAVLVEGLDEFVSRTEVIGDSLISSLGDLRTIVENNDVLAGAGIDLEQIKATGSALMSSGLLKPDAIEQLASLSAGVAKGNAAYVARPVEVGGALSLLRLLKDPDINAAISYLMTLAKSVGQELNAPTTQSVK